MTREEAIKEIEILKEDYWDDDGYGHETKQYDDTMLALDMAIKALEQEPIFNIMALLEKTYNDFCSCEGGDGWLKIDGKEYSTDAGYAIEGVDIFMEVFKRRLVESEKE